MAFFTRVNTNVPFLPSDECHSLDDNSSTLKRSPEVTAEQCTNDNSTTNSNNNESNNNSENSVSESGRYEYVVDRVLGVEV